MNRQSYSISLQAKTISDTFSAVSVAEPAIDEAITKTLFGNEFSFVVDSYIRDEKSGLYTIRGSYDIANMLNNDLSGSDYTAEASASSLFSDFAGAVGKTAVSHFDDYKPTGILVKKDSKWTTYETYGSAIQKIFGWTSIIPTVQVNVFERGNTLYAIQRGSEPNSAIDITGHCGDVTREYSKMRLLFDANKDYYLSGEAIDTNTDKDEGTTAPDTLYSGEQTENSGQQVLSYSYGLLRSEAFNSTDGTVKSTASYSYSNFYPPANLLSKTMTKTETLDPEIPELTESMLPYKVITSKVTTSTLTNTLSINGKDLVKSEETVSIVQSGYTITDTSGTTGTLADETESHTTTTLYSDMGQGHWSVTTTKDGTYSGSQVVTGNPGCKASPYAVKTYSTRRSKRGGYVLPARIKLDKKFNGSLSINVSDSSTLSRIASAISDLDGKTQEKVTLNYHGNSLIDFLAPIIYKGHTYYLESNNISVQPNMTIQSLVLLRWY